MRKTYNKRNQDVLQHDTNDLIYLAGFFDGEGHISLSKKSRDGNYDVNFIVANTNLEVLNWIASKFGGSVTACNKNGCNGTQTENIKYKNIYYWFPDKINLKHFLPEIIPFLIVKKKQAILLQEYFNYRIKNCGIGIKVEQELWKDKISASIKHLNNSNEEIIIDDVQNTESMFEF